MAKLRGYFKRLFTDSLKPTLLVKRARFVDEVGNQIAVAGVKAYGISTDSYDPATDNAKDKLPVTILGIEEIEAGAAFNKLTGGKYTRLTTDNQGRAVTVAADQAVNAWALDTADAAGDIVPVLLVDGYEPPADTAGATLGALETEVNKLKAALRAKL